MDDVQKSRIRLKHWIDHNAEHLKGYGEAALLIEQLGLPEVASRIREGIRLTESANAEFQKALERLPEQSGQGPEECCESHSHTHDSAHECGHHHHHKHGE